MEGELVGFFAGGVAGEVLERGAIGAVGGGPLMRADFVQIDMVARPFGHC